MKSIAIYVGLFGFLIRIYTIGFTPKNTLGRNTKEDQIAGELNTKGLYSLTRNPLYVGNFIGMGAVLFTGVFWFFILFIFIFWLYYERIIFAEEVFYRFVITNFLVVEFNFITYGTIFSFIFYIIEKTMQSSKLFSVE